MGTKRDIVEDSLDSGDSIEDNLHEDRRAKAKSKKRIPLWVKKSVLAYEKDLHELQIELLKLQNHIKATGQKVLFIFEGRDAAGKGGTIKRIIEHLNPRGARIVALDKPSDTQKTQWYFQRYTQHLPSAGEMVFFDRSWYNRAGVEPVMGFCTKEEHQEFLNQVALFEQMLINSDIKLFKFYYSVSQKEQAKRFKKRLTDPLKQYKLSPVDLESQGRWEEYSKAKLSMLQASHTDTAPWVIIRSDDKKKARLNTIRHILSKLPYENKKLTQTIENDILLMGDEEINIMQDA
jgi:polyphosphate kinase